MNVQNLLQIAKNSEKAAVFAGVLLLEKSYGRDKKNRLLFQCIPSNKGLPTFLVPYEGKIGFLKTVVNKYVLFSFVCWNREIPMGILQQVLGDVSSLAAYYDYLLYSAEMFKNVGWSKQPVDLIAPVVLNEAVETVFTIDNRGTVDFDDAFRFEMFEDGSCCVSVYITDMASIVFSGLSEDVSLDAVFSGVSTLYLPHRRIPMLLDRISQQGRLVEGSVRTCVAVRFFYDFKTGGLLRECCDKQVRVKVERNWTYSEVDEGGVADDLINLTGRLVDNQISAKQMVAFWMIRYGRFMAGHISGECFRRKQVGGGLGENNWMCRILEQQECSMLGGKDKLVFGVGSEGEKEDWIVPMTNPIRRKTDLYNQAIFLQRVCLDGGRGVEMAEILNQKMKIVTKIQRETHLLNFMENTAKTADCRVVDGIVYKVEPLLDEKTGCRFYVYLNVGDGSGGLGLFSSFKGDYSGYGVGFCGKFRLFYFCKSFDIKKKIRVEPVSD